MNFIKELEDLIEDYMSWKTETEEDTSPEDRRLVVITALQIQLTRLLEN